MVPRKEISQCACLVPWPERGGEPPVITPSAQMLHDEADRFGHEVIDLWWIRHVLKAVAQVLEELEREKRFPISDTCLSCGMQFRHVSGCKALLVGAK